MGCDMSVMAAGLWQLCESGISTGFGFGMCYEETGYCAETRVAYEQECILHPTWHDNDKGVPFQP